SLNSVTGSPYSARKNWLKAQEHHQQQQQQQQQHIEYRFSRPIKIVDYDNERYSWSAPGSPYHIRRPAFDRNRLWIEDDTSSESEIEHKPHRHHIINDLGDEDTFDNSDPPASMLNAETDTEPRFPITIRSARSLQSLRMRRDPQHQGTRTIKARRVVTKKGEGNVHLAHLPQRSLRFVRDIATTLVDEQWRYTLMLFVLCFVASWIFFAVLWYLIAYAHGDLLRDPKTGERLGDGSKPCVDGTSSFIGFLLFSVETQVSTGYGVIVPTEECPEAFFLLLVQIIFGLVIGGAMVGVVYAKMIRLPKRSCEMKFSKRAVICMRDGKLCFVFRVCDHKQQHVIGTKLTATMLEPRRHPGSSVIERYESRLTLQNNGRILPLWPITVCHVIDRHSPLYDISAADLLERRFEIVITMTGSTMTTGQGTQARTSFLPVEILWGHRFQNIIEYDPQRECYVAMNEQLDLLEEVDTPLCSARQLEEVIDELHNDQERSEQYPMDDDSRLGASFRSKITSRFMRSNPSSFVRFHDVYSEAEEEAHSVEGGKSYQGSLKGSQAVTVAIEDSIPGEQVTFTLGPNNESTTEKRKSVGEKCPKAESDGSEQQEELTLVTRVVNKIGQRNVRACNLPQRSIRFVKDLVTTLVEERWRYALLVFVSSYIGSWLLFAGLWYILSYAHGDLVQDATTGERLGDGAMPCVDGVTSFTDFLLFSMETQISTGYGAKVPTEECPESFGLLTIQLMVGLLIDASILGVVYAKLVRPPQKISEMKFSHRAVICQRDGQLCFVFRICDRKWQHAIETKVTAVMLESKRTAEGELIEKQESYLKLENDGRLILLWPVTACHVIDRDSPLYDLSPAELLERKLEIVITITGGTMTTGQINQARTSYVPAEICWGHRFCNIVEYDTRKQSYVAVNERMHDIEQIDTPLCSAHQLDILRKRLQNDVSGKNQTDLP
uniref:Uncharacterized protein n=1 Tax=Anopheles minimus TaxID=112268 RepID=A0A182W7T3_9DIPT